MVINKMNHKLTQEIALKELKVAVMSLSCVKALGHDGLPTKFFQETVEKIALELLVAYQTMLQLGQFLKFFNHGLIVLIPKFRDPLLIQNWRPITHLLDIIRPCQTGFVAGRSILVYLACESMDSAEKSNQRLVLLMHDFEKTFDCIN
jgi:hypothetical protein